MKERKLEKIILGVSSSISIYKSCEIIRLLQKKKYPVQVIMTRNASRMISPLLFSALSGHNVLIDALGEEQSETIDHVALTQDSVLLLVAPATANIIGKFASGVADDFLSTFFTVVRCPVLVAPAMNQAMFFHRQTQQNIQKLKASGVRFVEPEKGYLACKEEGWGRLASVERIVEEGLRLVRKTKTLSGKKVLVTAGPTREFLDPVRFLSNRSSGKMGYELAEEAWRRGAEVMLVSGPTHILPPPEVEFKRVETAEQMEKEVRRRSAKADIIIMAAAVSDFKFEKTSSQKIKKKEFKKNTELVRTKDVLKSLGKKKTGKILVGFAAETENLVGNAQKKLNEKKLDLIVANDISKEGIGFESDHNQVSLFSADGKTIQTKKRSKVEISQIILDRIEDIIGERG